MMNLRDLYQEVIIDHNRNPRHNYAIPQANCCAEGYNPLCGDKLSLYLKLGDERIIDAGFVGGGCAISTASASLMTESLIGLTVDEAEQLFENFRAAMVGNKEHACARLGKLAVFEGVKAFPARVKCATLAWHTLQAALAKRDETVSTE